MEKIFGCATVRFFILAATVALAHGAVISLPYGLDVNDPTFNRPVICAQGACGAATLSASGAAVHYQANTFRITGPGLLWISNIVGDAPSITNGGLTVDSVIVLYGPGGFDPQNPLANLIVVADGDPAHLNLLETRLEAVGLANGTYTAVFTTFHSVPFDGVQQSALPWSGVYAIIGDVAPADEVPEPTTMLALGAGLAVIALRRIRRS